MSILKGNLSLTRYRIDLEPREAEAITNEYLAERLLRNSFVDIDECSLHERSVGWVELLDSMGTNFSPTTFCFGDLIAFILRVDMRKVTPKSVARYFAIRERDYSLEHGRRPNRVARTELKEVVYSELARRVPLTTQTMEVVWFSKTNELWLAAVGDSIAIGYFIKLMPGA